MDIPAQLTALHAKIIGRLLEPERVPWKAYLSSWLAMPLTAEQRMTAPAQSQHLQRLGRGYPSPAFPIRASRPCGASWIAWRHSGSCTPTGWSAQSRCPTRRSWGSPCSTAGRSQPRAWEHWARQGRTTVEHLRDLLRSGAAQPAQQQEMALLLDAMPAYWEAHIYGPSPQPTHLASADPADRRVFCPAADGQLTHLHTASSTAALLPLGQPAQPMEGQDLPADLRPVLVMKWDPTRPWHPSHSATQHQVLALGPKVMDPRSWGFLSAPAHEYVVRASASCLRALPHPGSQARRCQPHQAHHRLVPTHAMAKQLPLS